MLKFLCGVAVGVVAARPVLGSLDVYLPQAVHAKLISSIRNLTNHIHDVADALEERRVNKESN